MNLRRWGVWTAPACVGVVVWFATLWPWGPDAGARYARGQMDWLYALQADAAVIPAHVWTAITALGDAWVLVGLASPLLLTRWPAFRALMLALPIAGVFSAIGKWALHAPRPGLFSDAEVTLIGDVASGGYNSTPSGHALTVFAVVAAVATSCDYRDRRLVLGATLLCVLGCVVAFSRVAVGAHWPADVVLGALLGWIAGTSGGVLAVSGPGRWLADATPPVAGWRIVTGLLLLTACALVYEAVASSDGGFVRGAAFALALTTLALRWRATRDGQPDPAAPGSDLRGDRKGRGDARHARRGALPPPARGLAGRGVSQPARRARADLPHQQQGQ